MKTVEINNKHYINAKVLILSADKIGLKGDLVLNNYVSNPHKLFYASVNCEAIYQQHLYVISNEEIKKSDWCLLDNNVGESVGFEIKKCLEADIINGEYTFKENNGDLFTTGRCDKIIATTNSSLKVNKTNTGVFKDLQYELPQLSKKFIESYIELYNNGNIIEDVLVELEQYYFDIKLKLKNNIIIIKDSLGEEVGEIEELKNNSFDLIKSKEMIDNILFNCPPLSVIFVCKICKEKKSTKVPAYNGTYAFPICSECLSTLRHFVSKSNKPNHE